MAETAILTDASGLSIERSEPSVQRFAARVTGSRLFWSVFVLLGFALPIVRSMTRPLPPAPPVLLSVPAFSCVDAAGQAFTLREMRGRIVVAELVLEEGFTSAPPSPLAQLQRRVRNTGDVVHLVTFVRPRPGADPKATATELSRFARAGEWRWTFAAGDTAPLVGIVKELGFVPDGKLVLIDRVGRIRRVVGTSTEEIDQVMRDIGLLANNLDSGEPARLRVPPNPLRSQDPAGAGTSSPGGPAAAGKLEGK